ncbi:related to meiotic recombination protein SPO11 [Melanopsichium pennsylvanicum]|uniref:Related to meiotic recombination protein SPO11 n=1 Tax=Melanopsichium pennsylvanicum TaxID=63383 RepID=A0AAJ4XPL1_9BASI|nr:related to meiotic recombination protein SPO11 [Melanopsichium pennsylvanicum]
MHVFASQQASDRTIDRVVSLLNCTNRVELGIVASPRGLISGPLTLISTSSTGETIQCSTGVTTLIPVDITYNVNSGDRWKVELDCTTFHNQNDLGDNHHHLVVVVEKEAVFKHLVQNLDLISSSSNKEVNWWEKVIFLTGKGYPDHATKALVKLLSQAKCSRGQKGNVRIIGIFDGDPYGVDIHDCYTEVVEWIGIDPEEFLKNQMDSCHSKSSSSSSLIPLRNDEREIAVRLLRNFKLAQRNGEKGAKTRLTNMLLMGYKVEIEAAYKFDHHHDNGKMGLKGYLEHKLFPLPPC